MIITIYLPTRCPLRPTARLLAVAVTGIVACGTATACGSPAGAPPSNGKIIAVASTDVWASVIKSVGKDAVTVSSIIDSPAKDPHDYETTPADAATIAEARLAVYNGDGYDDFFAKDLRATGGPKQTVVAFDISGKPPGEDTNEHVFYDLPTVKKVAGTIAKDLGALRPAKRGVFAANARAFDAGVDGLLAKAHKIGTNHPGKKVVATEPVAGYLLRAAGIQDVTPPAFEHAVEAGTDIPASAINDMDTVIGSKQVAALVNNAQTADTTTARLKQRAAGAGIPVIDVTETLPAGVSGYLPWMSQQIDALAAAMAKPPRG